MKNRNQNHTNRRRISLLLLPALLIAVTASFMLFTTVPASAAWSASNAIDDAFIGEADFEEYDDSEYDDSAEDVSGTDAADEAESSSESTLSDSAAVTGQFIFDTSGIDESELASLEAQAQQLYEDYGLGIYYAEVRDDSDEDTITRAAAFYQTHCAIEDGVLLFLTTSESSNEYHVYLSGRAEHIFTEEETDQIWDVFVTDTDSDGKTYAEGIADYLTYMGEVMEAHGLQVIPSTRTASLLVDDADLLADWEEESLLQKLEEISEKEQMDVAVVTVNSLDGKSPEAYADDYYDYNGYGQGENRDGVLLLISMADRDWQITTTGFGITAVNDAAIELIEDRMLSDLSDGDYYDAFSSYASTVGDVAEMARNGEPYTGGSMSSLSTGQRVGGAAVAGIIIGCIAGMIGTSVQKKNLKRVRRQHGANAYIYGDASNLSVSDDRFIRRNVVRTRIQKDDNRGGGGGSMTHFGGSGTMHGGGGGKF